MQVSNEIIAVLDSIAKHMGTVIDWTKDNVWAYIQELMKKYVSYELYSNIIWSIMIMLAIIGIIVVFLVMIYRLHHSNLYGYDEAHVKTCIYGLCIVLVLIFGGMGFITYIDKIIQCVTIPEKVFYDYVMGCIK